MARRNAVIDFFNGFNQGYDTTGRVLQDVDLARVANAKPETSQGYTGADGDQLTAMANARDENGNPYYTLSANEDGSYRVKNNWQVDGAQAPDATIAPRRVTDFLGRRYDGEVSEAQLANARMRAMADVIAKNDPVRGLSLRQQALQGEREDARFQREQQEGDLRLAGLRRADTQGQRVEDIQRLQDEVARYTPEQLHSYAATANAASGTDVPLLYTGRTKDGYQFVTTDPTTHQPMRTVTLNDAQTRQLATAAKLLEAGYGAEGIQLMAGVSKELNDLVTHLNSTVAQTTTSQNQALHMGTQDRNDTARTGAAVRQSGAHSKLLGMQLDELAENRANNKEARAIRAEYDSLTPAEQMGPKGQALVRRHNILNAKPGTQINLGLQRNSASGTGRRGPAVDLKRNDDGTYTAVSRDDGNPVYTMTNGQKIPLGMTSDEYTRLRTEASQLNVPMEGGYDEAGNYVLGFRGRDGLVHDTPREAYQAKAGKTTGTQPTTSAAPPPFSAENLRQIQRGLSVPARATSGAVSPSEEVRNLLALADAMAQAPKGAGGLDLSRFSSRITAP